MRACGGRVAGMWCGLFIQAGTEPQRGAVRSHNRRGGGCTQPPSLQQLLWDPHSLWLMLGEEPVVRGSSPARVYGAGFPVPADSASKVQRGGGVAASPCTGPPQCQLLSKPRDATGLSDGGTAPTFAVSGMGCRLTPVSPNLWGSVSISPASPSPKPHPR